MPDSFWEQLTTVEFIDWAAMLAGIIGVSLSIKERIGAWPFFIFCYSAYIYISFRSGYYAFGVMNSGFIGIAAYGWAKWSGLIASDKTKDSQLEISTVSTGNWLFIALFITIFTAVIGSLLAQTEQARLPYIDAFAVANAVVAQWMLSRKHIENWLFWILSDIIYVGLFFNDRLWPSTILFSVFIILAINGWFTWKKSLLASRQVNLASPSE